MTPATALAYWERALEEEIGIIIVLATVDTKRIVEKALYEARQASGNPALMELRLCKPGDRLEELWLVKKSTDMEDVL
jgi:hypothetical protein